MTKQFLKTVLAGIMVGLALFMMPFFLLRIFLFFMLIAAAFRLLGFGRYRREMRYAFAQRYQNMSEDERKAFKQKWGNRCCSYPEHETPFTPSTEETK